MINTIIKIDNTDKKKRQMKDQKRNEMSVSEQRKRFHHFLDFTYYRFLFL